MPLSICRVDEIFGRPKTIIAGSGSGLARLNFTAMVVRTRKEGIDVGMIIGLTRTRRVGAGWFVALTYLVCVLAPTLSFALPGSRAVTPCLTEAAHGPGIVHMHTDAPIQQIRIDDHVHDHANVHSHPSTGDQDRSMALNGKSVPEKAPHSSD